MDQEEPKSGGDKNLKSHFPLLFNRENNQPKDGAKDGKDKKKTIIKAGGNRQKATFANVKEQKQKKDEDSD